eukprot:SAG11_NODE_2002_length_3938_cov_2.562126_3_plen_63_part_00
MVENVRHKRVSARSMPIQRQCCLTLLKMRPQHTGTAQALGALRKQDFAPDNTTKAEHIHYCE